MPTGTNQNGSDYTSRKDGEDFSYQNPDGKLEKL